MPQLNKNFKVEFHKKFQCKMRLATLMKLFEESIPIEISREL